MSTESKTNNSEDEFESADEGEASQSSPVKPADSKQMKIISPPPVTDGWGDWNLDDEVTVEKPAKNSNRALLQQDSASSLSSSPSKTGGSASRNGSDDDDRNDSPSEQQTLQRKKLRKKLLESHLSKEENKSSTRISRRDEDSSSASVTKHDVKDAHHVLDRLAAQSPTRTVHLIHLLLSVIHNVSSRFFSQAGINLGAISAPSSPMPNKV